MPLPANAMTRRAGAMLALLVLLGFLGNYYSLPLFFGTDFVFGSITVLLILYFYGLSWGLLAAIVVNSYTYFLWGHPYAFIVFFLEALFVGYLLRSGRRNLFLLDGLFWLLIGFPLNWIFYHVVLNMDAVTTGFIILKQGINGIFNALLAGLAINFLPLDRLLGRPPARRPFSLQEGLFNLMAVLVLVPALLLTVVEIRGEMKSFEQDMATDLEILSADIRAHLHFWYRQHLQAVTELAGFAAKSSLTPSHGLQSGIELIKRTFPAFHNMYVANAAGITVGFYPPLNEKGESTIGLNFSDRPYFKELQKTKGPVMSEVFMGRGGVFKPIVTLSVPIIQEDRFAGFALGALNLGEVQELLEPYGRARGETVTLTDAQWRVIASTSADRAPMQLYDRNENGVMHAISGTLFRWSPPDNNLPSLTRWKQSYFVKQTGVDEDISWILTVEAPIAPHQQYLYAIYVQNLSVMAVMTGLILLLALALSRWLAKPLNELAQVTTDLPDKIMAHRNIDWPASMATEVDSLIVNFQFMTLALGQNFTDLEERGQTLAKTNEELKIEISEREQAEETLRQTEKILKDLLNQTQLILDSAAEGILGLDIEGKHVFVNPAATRMLGYEEEELIGSRSHSTWHHSRPDGAPYPEEECPIHKTLKSGVGHYVEEVFWRKDGSSFPVEVKSNPIIEDGKIIGTVVTFWDISERQRTEEALRQSELTYRSLVQTIPAVVYKGYEDWSVDFFDDKIEEITGYQKEEFDSRKMKWSDLILPEDFQNSKNVVRQALKTNKFYLREYRITDKKGNHLWIQERGRLVCDKENHIDYINGVLFNITEMKKFEEDRLMLSKIESLGLLAGGIAHDFNNILTAILGNIGLTMLDPMMGDRGRQRLAAAEKACLQAQNLAGQLLTFAKGGVPIKELVSLENLVKEAGSLACRGSQVRCEYDFTKDLMPIEGDPGQMNQVFQNLIINAIQAMPGGGTVKIQLENVKIGEQSDLPLQGGNYVKISIQDHGGGIPEKYLEKIFDPYFTTKQQGSGLGLATAYSIVNNHHGHISVESRLGEGTTFHVYLPASDRKIIPQPQELRELLSGKGKILVMDDEAMVREVLGEMLRTLGYEAEFAKDGVEAIESFSQAQGSAEPFAAVILDLTIPGGMGGKETIEALLKIDPHVKAIVSSGYSDDPIMADFKKYGFSEVIAKPYRISELSKILQKVIPGKQVN